VSKIRWESRAWWSKGRNWAAYVDPGGASGFEWSARVGAIRVSGTARNITEAKRAAEAALKGMREEG
jgi:hypothetical protein